jgi:SAM-dependent methyltransferase
MVAAYHTQRERVWPSEDMWSGTAGNFKPDLRAPLNAVQQYVASHLLATDTLLDVGGGAGRMSLPLAKRCGEIVCIDPSPSMKEIFEASARDAIITNARFVHQDWLQAIGLEGDISLVSHVTYFVPAIKPFLAKLNSATRRRVIVAVRSVPPPNQFAPFFQIATGEDQLPVPGAEHLLAVLNKLSLPAEVVDLGEAPVPVTAPVGKTPDEAIKIQAEGGVRLGWLRSDAVDRFTELVRPRFDEIFVLSSNGYRPRTMLGVSELVITWETRR